MTRIPTLRCPPAAPQRSWWPSGWPRWRRCGARAARLLPMRGWARRRPRQRERPASCPAADQRAGAGHGARRDVHRRAHADGHQAERWREAPGGGRDHEAQLRGDRHDALSRRSWWHGIGDQSPPSDTGWQIGATPRQIRLRFWPSLHRLRGRSAPRRGGVTGRGAVAYARDEGSVPDGQCGCCCCGCRRCGADSGSDPARAAATAGRGVDADRLGDDGHAAGTDRRHGPPATRPGRSVERLRLPRSAAGLRCWGSRSAGARHVWLIAMPLSVPLVGLVLLLAVVPTARALADLDRTISGALLGEPLRAASRHRGMPPFARLWTWLRDARWRDLGYLWFSATGGRALDRARRAAGGPGRARDLVPHRSEPRLDVPAVPLRSDAAHLVVGDASPGARTGVGRPRHPRARPGGGAAERVAVVEESRSETLDHQAAEIRRIERDLHDGAQARIAAVGMNVGLAEKLMATDPEAAAALLREARRTTVSALEDMRSVVRGIRPPVLSDLGLAGAIEAMVVPIPSRLQSPWKVRDCRTRSSRRSTSRSASAWPTGEACAASRARVAGTDEVKIAGGGRRRRCGRRGRPGRADGIDAGGRLRRPGQRREPARRWHGGAHGDPVSGMSPRCAPHRPRTRRCCATA